MEDLSPIEDLKVAGDFVIPAPIIREQIQWAIENRHASCYFQRFSGANGSEVIAIIDLYDDRWPTLSVTNDAEYVVRLAVGTQGDYPILYRDTEGRWDELRHRSGYFACFRSLGTENFSEAVQRLVALQESDKLAHGAS